MGLENIMAKVAEKLGRKASGGTHKPGNLPKVEDIEASLTRFKKPTGMIEKTSEQTCGLFDKIKKAAKPKAGGIAGIVEKVKNARK